MKESISNQVDHVESFVLSNIINKSVHPGRGYQNPRDPWHAHVNHALIGLISRTRSQRDTEEDILANESKTGRVIVQSLLSACESPGQ